MTLNLDFMDAVNGTTKTIKYAKRDTGGTDPKTTALTTLGLSMGAKENIITFLRIKDCPDVF